MILDTLSNSARYEALHPGLSWAFAFLRTVDGTQALGRHDLDGDRCFALVQRYEGRPIDAALFEAHRRYLDVQFVFSGRETILWAPVDAMREEISAYDADRDIVFWKVVPEHTVLQLSAGQFTIFEPQDAHAPSLAWGAPETVFKIVVKVAMDW